MSGYGDEDVAVKMVEMGAEDYLVKGRIDRHSLVRAMRYGIERNRLKRELNRAHDELEQRVQERTAALADTRRSSSRNHAEPACSRPRSKWCNRSG